jgi:hypothetical protein
MLVTMLNSFHNHIHGAALVLVPGMLVASCVVGPTFERKIGVVSLVVPFVLLWLTGKPAQVAMLIAPLLVAALLSICLHELQSLQLISRVARLLSTPVWPLRRTPALR